MLYFYLIAPETQLHLAEGAGGIHFTGVCGQDGHSQAPMDGFMVSREVDATSPGLRAEKYGVIRYFYYKSKQVKYLKDNNL